MDDLLQTALLGTAKQPAPPADHPADTLVARLQDQSPERQLLLRAGARTVHDLAGYVPQQAEPIPAAPPDTRPVCTRRAAQILADWLAAHQQGLLIEAYQRLDRAGQRLPPDMLPKALAGCNWFSIYQNGGPSDTERKTTAVPHRFEYVYQAVLPILGQRGQWLYQFHQQSIWGAESSSAPGNGAPNPAPDQDEENWKAAPHRERQWTLERLRKTDPDRARQWLAAAWPTEKAEHRAEFLEELAVGLSARDEEFLEQALADRSAEVRRIAARLLARLPESALSRQVRELAEGILVYMPVVVRRKLGAAPTTPSARGLVGTLAVNLPHQFDKAWKRLGIEEKPPTGKGARSFWASQLLALVPPSHWESQLQVPAKELIEAAESCEDGVVILEAWSEAAPLFEEQTWIQLLWDWWYRQEPPKRHGPASPDSSDWLLRLAKKIDAPELEQRAIRILENPDSDHVGLLPEMMEDLRRPWSVALARKYLKVLRGYLVQLTQDPRSQDNSLYETLYPAAVSLSDACFDEALQGWDFLLAEEEKPSAGRRIAVTALDKFLPVVRLRKELRDQVASLTPTGDHS
jgi:hypothetical protein